MKTKRFIYNTIFILTLVFIIVCLYLNISGYIESNIFIVLVLTFGYVLYEFFKYNNASQPIFLKVVLVFIPLLAIGWFVLEKNANYEIKKYGCTTWYAVIYDKYSSYNSSNNICFTYKTEKGVVVNGGVQTSTKETYRKLNVGDTILIAISNFRANNYMVVSYFPTHEEIQEFKKGKPYEPKKQKNK